MIKRLLTLSALTVMALGVQAADVPSAYTPSAEFSDFLNLHRERVMMMTYEDFMKMTVSGFFNNENLNTLVSDCQQVDFKTNEFNNLNLDDFNILERRKIKKIKQDLAPYGEFCNALNTSLQKEN